MSEELDNRRKELFNLNSKVWKGEYKYVTASKLDSSLKKNTTFIKKIKTSINIDQCKGILKDIASISLEKYLSEIITAITEGLFKITKNDDILSAMEIVSALHQRFSNQFTPYILANVLNGLANPNRQSATEQDREKDDQLRISKQKNLIKLLMEFYLIGLFRTIKECDKDALAGSIYKKFSRYPDEPIIVLVLKDILNFEIKSGNSLTIVQVFLKRFNHVIYNEDYELLSLEVKHVLRQILKRYTLAVFEVLVYFNKKLQQVSEKNKKSSIRTGKILEENLNEFNQVNSLFEKFKVNCEFLSNTLNIDMPELPSNEVETAQEESVVEVVKSKSINEDDLGIWDSVKDKNFYTKIPELSELIGINESTIVVESGSSGEKIGEFINKLENASSDQEVDQLVIEFNNLNLNNKATKNRILKFFIDTSNVINLKYYTRFLKINEANLKHLIDELIEHLDKGFRSQIYHNKLNFKNIFFFVELIKFKMIPTHIIFHKIRSLTVNISSTNNIDILSVFYEHVGRFLLNDPDYKDLMIQMFELLKLKQKNEKLSTNDKLAINNLLIIIDPPTTKITNLHNLKPNLTPKQQFLNRLLRVELNPKSLAIILSLLKKLDFANDKEARSTLLDIFAQPELLNYENITELARVLENISKKYKSILIITIDTIIEKILRGLELNDYRLNRIRISHVKLISELYNLKVLNFKFINDLLYKILCYGHPNNQPLPSNYDIEIDLPDNYFRIQLCCIILTTVNSILIDDATIKKSSSKLKSIKKKNEINKDLLRIFLTFFQYYMFCKKLPIPIEIEFKLNDVFIKYSEIEGIERFGGLRESLKKLQEIIQEKGFKQAEEEYDDEEDDAEEDGEDEEDEEDDEDDDEDDDDSDDSSTDSDSDIDTENDNDAEYEDEEDDEVEEDAEQDISINIDEKERNQLSEEDKKFSDELNKEFQKIVIESYEYNKNTSTILGRNKFNVPIPSKTLLNNSSQTKIENKVSFSLLTKSGKKTNVKQVNLPTDNKFAESLLKEKADQQQQRERIMNLVLNMED